MKKYSKTELSWILYDCGNSAYSLAITTALFPVYFGMIPGNNSMNLGYFNALASIVIAILSPILGTIADYKGFKKNFFVFFSLLGIISTGLLGFIPETNIPFIVSIFVITNIGFAGANIFYDAFIVDVTTDDRMDKISSNGFGYGYIASIIPFIITLLLILKMGMGSFGGYQIGFLITAIWWGIFTIPLIKNVTQKHYIQPEPHPIKNSFLRLAGTFKNIKNYRTVFMFLIAYFFYIDGVDTIIKMAVPYSQAIFGVDATSTFFLLGVLLVVQIVAFPFAIIYGNLAEKFTAKKMIVFAICTYFVAVVFAFFMTELWHVFILGAMIGSAQGGIQSLSRSYFAKIIPKENANEFFGFYNIFGKFAAIIGPLLMSLTTTISGNARYSILSIIPLFLIGLIIFVKLPDVDDSVSI